MNLLNLGCGTRVHSQWRNVDRVPAAPGVLAVDVRRGLPFPDGSFELVTLMNMIPFFDELARVTAPGGAVVVSFSRGAETPIYVPQERLRRRLARRGFTQFADFSAAPATALRAVRGRVPGNGSSRHGRTGPDA